MFKYPVPPTILINLFISPHELKGSLHKPMTIGNILRKILYT